MGPLYEFTYLSIGRRQKIGRGAPGGLSAPASLRRDTTNRASLLMKDMSGEVWSTYLDETLT